MAYSTFASGIFLTRLGGGGGGGGQHGSPLIGVAQPMVCNCLEHMVLVCEITLAMAQSTWS